LKFPEGISSIHLEAKSGASYIYRGGKELWVIHPTQPKVGAIPVKDLSDAIATVAWIEREPDHLE